MTLPSPAYILLLLLTSIMVLPEAMAEEASALSPRKRRKKTLKLCNEYNGKLISYYDTVFKVVNCQRVPIDHTAVNQHLKKGEKIFKVTSEVIYLIPLQKTQKKKAKASLSCKDIDGEYVTADHEVIYFIDRCKKRRFPDWQTYQEHRHRRGIHQSQFLLVDQHTLAKLRSRPDFPSSLPYTTSPLDKDPTTQLSRTQLCQKLEGQFISYFSQVYYVEKCRKRPLDSLAFSRFTARLLVPPPEEKTSENTHSPREAIEATEATNEEKAEQGETDANLQSHETDQNPYADPYERLPEVIQITDDQWIRLPLGKPYNLKNYVMPSKKDADQPTTTSPRTFR